MKKAYLELICYGLASGFSALMFVFGVMYPEYIYTEDAYRVITEEGLSIEDLEKPVYQLDRSKVRVSSKLYESIIELLEDWEHDERCISVRDRSTVSGWGKG